MKNYVVFDGKAVEIVDEADYLTKQERQDALIGTNSSFIPTQDGKIEIGKQTSEIAEAIKMMNDDELDPKTGMSKIDMNSRLHGTEISSILIIDFLVANRVLPRRMLSLTRQKKRLSISEGGEGRKEAVTIAGGIRENQQGKGLFGRIKDVFSPPKV